MTKQPVPILTFPRPSTQLSTICRPVKKKRILWHKCHWG